MNKRLAKRIATELASNLLNSELSNQALWAGMPYTEVEIAKIHGAMEELVSELDLRGNHATDEYLDDKEIAHEPTA